MTADVPQETGLEEVLHVVAALDAAGIACWLEGGWGVDALAGRRRRPHRDVDIDLDARQEGAALEVLRALGYWITTDERPTRVELSSSRGRVDLHPLRFGAEGDAWQQAPDGSAWHFLRRWFTVGSLDGERVGCFTAEAQRRFREGYPPRPQDLADLAVLDELDGGRRTVAEA